MDQGFEIPLAHREGVLGSEFYPEAHGLPEQC